MFNINTLHSLYANKRATYFTALLTGTLTSCSIFTAI